jgi:hypothetical protein
MSRFHDYFPLSVGGGVMRSKEFKRTPFTDWMDNIERVCVECGRKFDLMDEEQSSEWHYGHDCEEATA